jgi:hypothetical protein
MPMSETTVLWYFPRQMPSVADDAGISLEEIAQNIERETRARQGLGGNPAASSPR